MLDTRPEPHAYVELNRASNVQYVYSDHLLFKRPSFIHQWRWAQGQKWRTRYGTKKPGVGLRYRCYSCSLSEISSCIPCLSAGDPSDLNEAVLSTARAHHKLYTYAWWLHTCTLMVILIILPAVGLSCEHSFQLLHSSGQNCTLILFKFIPKLLDCYGSFDEQRLFSVKFARFRNFFDFSGTHVVIHNWSFVVKLCGTTALSHKSFVVQLHFPTSPKVGLW